MKQPIQNVDPIQVWLQATDFHMSAGILMKSLRGKNEAEWPTIAFPNMVLKAFASELYLKCLHAIDSAGTVPQGHHLKILFDQVHPMRQQAVTRHYYELSQTPDKIQMVERMERIIGEPVPRDLPTILSECGDGFVDLRYPYEPNQNSKFYGLDEFPDAVRHTILEIYPTWRTVRRGKPKLLPNN